MADFKIYNLDQYKIFKSNYYSLDDFLDCLISKPINSEIFISKESEKYDPYNWSGTNTFKEAWELCKFTYDEKYEEFRDKVNKINYKIQHKIEKKDCYKPVGSSVNIPRFLFGIPDNMRNKEEVLTKPTINIFYQIAYEASTSKEQVINRGVLTLALINYLENVKHYRVNFNFFELSKENDEIIYIDINLENKDEKLKIKKCYFPIVHPSFLRRLIFRADEIIQGLQYSSWAIGYGTPIKFEDAKYIIENDLKSNNKKELLDSIYISTPNELNIQGNNIDEDLDNFIKIINNKYNIFDEKQKKKEFKL